MGYYELLPKREALLNDLLSIGVTDNQQCDMVVDSVCDLLGTWSEYYDTQYQMYGEKADAGARDALQALAGELLPEDTDNDLHAV